MEQRQQRVHRRFLNPAYRNLVLMTAGINPADVKRVHVGENPYGLPEISLSIVYKEK